MRMALLLALGCNPGTIALGPSDKPIGTDTDLDSGTDTVTTDTGDSAGTTTPPIPSSARPPGDGMVRVQTMASVPPVRVLSAKPPM